MTKSDQSEDDNFTFFSVEWFTEETYIFRFLIGQIRSRDQNPDI